MGKQLLSNIKGDVEFYASANGGTLTTRAFIRNIVSRPSVRAAILFRIASRVGVVGTIARNVLMTMHACDVAAGAQFSGPILLPHPVAIVIGKGARVGSRVTIYQGVTLGANRKGQYPAVEDDVTVFPNSVVAGDVVVGAGCVIGAGSFVGKSMLPGSILRPVDRSGD